MLGVEALYAKRDSIFGQFPVRIALPGGGDVLEPTNDSAAGLPLGTAVVNTAGGLGGPRGATRGHERVVRFPDPHADRTVLSDLRHRLWGARDPEAQPPRIFAGYAHQHLADDPTYRAALAGRAGRPAALVGRVIDVNLSTAAFPLDSSPGRHLAIFGSQRVRCRGAGGGRPQSSPRSTRRVPPGLSSASLVAEGDELAKALAVEIGHRQEVVVVDAAGLAAELDLEQPGYRVVFGMDAASSGTLPGAAAAAARGAGPRRAPAVLVAWAAPVHRGDRRQRGPGGRGRPGLPERAAAGRVADAGPPVDWQPRANRALLHDRHADRTVTVVPFVGPRATSDDRSTEQERQTRSGAADPPAPGRGPTIWPPRSASTRCAGPRASASSEQAATVQAAQQELAAVRARLAPQRARLVQDLGVPEVTSRRSPPSWALAAQAVAGGPAAVLAALRQARGTADAADAAMLVGPAPPAPWRPWARNLLIYGPFAAAVLIVQIVLYLVAPSGSLPTYALLCGLSMPVLAFGLGWVTIGFVYGGGAGKVDRTPDRRRDRLPDAGAADLHGCRPAARSSG